MNSKTGACSKFIAFAGDGRLRDGSAASAEFREYVSLFLSGSTSKVLRSVLGRSL